MGLSSLPVIYLGSNYGGGNKDNGDVLQKVPCTHCCTQCPQPCSKPSLTPTPPDTPGHLRASLGQSLWCHFSPGSWCTQGFVCARQESVSHSCVSSRRSMVELMATSSKRAYAIPRSAAPRAPAPTLLTRTSLVQFSSVQFSRSVMSNSLRPHESQHAKPPCPSPTPRVHPNSCPSSR